jgi:hypothetical protein
MIYDEDWIKDDLIAQASIPVSTLVTTNDTIWHQFKDKNDKLLAELSLMCIWIPNHQVLN